MVAIGRLSGLMRAYGVCPLQVIEGDSWLDGTVPGTGDDSLAVREGSARLDT